MESYRTMGNIVEVRKHSKQRKIDVHDESRTIVYSHKHEIIDDKEDDKERDMESNKIVTVAPLLVTQMELLYLRNEREAD